MLLPRDVVGQCISEWRHDGVFTKIMVGNSISEALVPYRYENTEKHEQKQLTREAVRESFYRAFVNMTDEHLVWGSLVGVKPAKVASKLLAELGTIEATMATLQHKYHVSPQRAQLATQSAVSSQLLRETLPNNGVSLYISIPFCPSRCSYCSFVSQSTERENNLIEPYLAALLRELECKSVIVKQNGQAVDNIYIGGGTPTVLTAAQLDILLSNIATHFDLSVLREYTVEAGRPETCTAERLRVLKAHGVTRLSINPQSMNQSVLDAIGRKHTVQDVYTAVDIARVIGCDVINMDIIAGLPGDTPDGFSTSLDAVRCIAPENITVHTMTKKRGAAVTEPVGDEKIVNAMTEYSIAALSNNYSPYYLYRQKFMATAAENIGWSMNGKDCAYNICMMDELCTVIGIGAGAASKIHKIGGKIERIANAKFPIDYIRGLNHAN